MRIVLAGGGSGGHFYPLIAVAEQLNTIADREKIVDMKLYYFAPEPYDKNALFENHIEYDEVSAGKIRPSSSLHNIKRNIGDMFRTVMGIIQALAKLWNIYPDVVIGKGGYASFPVLFAARILRIPVLIHESDAVPGRVNKWAGKFAARVAVSFPEAAQFFPKERTAVTGLPIRKEIKIPATEGEFEFFHLDPHIPVVLVLGGSQGAEIINQSVVDILPTLVSKYQIIHQTGPKNLDDVIGRAGIVLGSDPNASRYKPFGLLSAEQLRMASGVASCIISRAGSSIFEFAIWGIPAILIPITNANGDHQRKNAYAYARAGACKVIEEVNLSPAIIDAELDLIIKNPETLQKMSESALAFARPDAAEKIAVEALEIALSHK